MKRIKNLMANAIAVCGGIFLISAISLMAALIAQYIYGLQPCPLCIMQRWPFVITALLGAAGMVILYRHEGEKWAARLVFASSVVFLAGSAIAFYHTGIEQHWWSSMLEGCNADLEAASAEDLMALLDSKPAVRCDVIPWADPVFGISMAGYNAMMSFALAIGCAFSSVMIMRKRNGVL